MKKFVTCFRAALASVTGSIRAADAPSVFQVTKRMVKEHSILHAILWAAAIIASALLHGPLDLTLILTSLASVAVVSTDRPTDRSA